MKGGTSTANRNQQSKTEKESPAGKFQPTPEQVRYAQLLNKDDPEWKKNQIQQIVELTKKPPDEVAIALHDCNYIAEAAINNLLEGKYDQGEWQLCSNRKKKSHSTVDSISSMKGKADNVQRKGSRDSNDGTSQSVEFNNRKNKGQTDRVVEINDNIKQNGPLSSTRPPGAAGRNRNNDDNWGEQSKEQRDDQDNWGDRKDNWGDRRDNWGDRRDNWGGKREDTYGNRRDQNGYKGNKRDDKDNWVDRRDQSGNRGNRGDSRGTRGSRTDRGGYRGERDDRGGNQDNKRGGRGGFNRRGGVGRGGRGSRSRGRFPSNSTRPFTRRPEMNGPTNDTDFGKSEDWGVSDNIEAIPGGTTDDWGAEDGGNEVNTTSNVESLSWGDEPVKNDHNDDDDWGTEKTTEESLPSYINHHPECDDEAILSSKVATSHQELPSFSQPPPSVLENATSFSLLDVVNPKIQKDVAQNVESDIADKTSSDVQATNDQRQPQRQQKPRSRRVQKNQIPKQAVEMPRNNGGIDSLDVQFGNLEFGDKTPSTTTTTTQNRNIEQQQQKIVQQHKQADHSQTPHNGPLQSSQPISPVVPKSVPMTTVETPATTSFDQMSPRHYTLAGTATQTTKVTPESSPRKEKKEVPRTPPTTRKVDVSTSPMTSTMQAMVKNEMSRGTQLLSDPMLDERVHQQAPAIGGTTSSPRSDQNTLRSQLAVTTVPATSSTRGAQTTGEPPNMNTSIATGAPPPGIIQGIQTNVSAVNTVNGQAKLSGARQHPHGTKPPNLPPGVLPLYGMQHPPSFQGFSPLPYQLDEMQGIPRMPMPSFYDVSFSMPGRDTVQNTYSGADVKYNRNDNSSPVPSSLNAAPHLQQAPFMNTHAQLHPFNYPNLAFYPGAGMIGGFPAPYPTQLYQLPAKGPGITTQFQQNFANQLGPHYTSGYDGLTNTHDFKHQYQSQSKTNAVSGTTVTNTGTDLTAAYKPSFVTDKGYLSGTPPPPLNLPLSGQGHQAHPAGFPIMMTAQHPPSGFQSHPLPQQQLETLNQNRGAGQNQGKQNQSKQHHGQSMYSAPFWSGTN